jgi:hypothetical protein
MMQDFCNQLIQSGLRLPPINPQTTIPLKHLDQRIREVTGHHDERIIKRHIQNLVKYGYIADKGYTGSFLILDTGTDLEHIERVMEQQKQEENNNNKQAELEAIKQQEFDSVIKDFK